MLKRITWRSWLKDSFLPISCAKYHHFSWLRLFFILYGYYLNLKRVRKRCLDGLQLLQQQRLARAALGRKPFGLDRGMITQDLAFDNAI